MNGKYDIYLDGQAVGRALVEQQGLYLRFDCRCQIRKKGIWRVTVRCGDRTENLGILVPDGSGAGLTVRLAARRLGEGELSFQARPKDQRWDRSFVPVYPHEPFSYLTKLRQAVLEVRDGQVGLVIDP